MVVKKHKDRKMKKETYYFEFQLNGLRRKQSGFKTQREAEKAEEELKYKIRNNLLDEQTDDIFNDYIQKWLKRRDDLGDNTTDIYLSVLKNHILPFFQGVKIKDIRPIDIQNLLDNMRDKNLSGSALEKAYTILKKCFSDTVRLELINKNPVDGISKPKRKKKELQILEAQDLKEFLTFAETQTRYAFGFKLAAHTGMRRGELLALTWSDIDLDRKLITIRKKLVKSGKKNNRYVQDGTKTNSGRTVTISNYLVEEAKKHKKVQEIEKECLEYEDNNLVIATSKGTHVYVDNFTRAFRDTLKASKFSNVKITLHDLRHIHASLLIKGNTHMKIVSERLGHSGIKTTMDVYSHLSPSMQQEAADNFERLMDNNK